ncbi:MAG: LPS export ABC transporter ATP-binding protein [Alphaproteobacteria bacterium]
MSINCYGDEKESPVIIQGDEIIYKTEPQEEALVNGNVSVECKKNKNAWTLKADFIVVKLNKKIKNKEIFSNNIKYIESKGKVTFKKDDLIIDANRCVYYPECKTDHEHIKCYENVKLKQNGHYLEGSEGEVDIKTGIYRIMREKKALKKKVMQLFKKKTSKTMTDNIIYDESFDNSLYTTDIDKTIKKRPILQCINLRLNNGEIVALLGPNGAGKTTFFSILIGLIYPDFGKVFLKKKDITFTPMYQRARMGLGYLPQDVSIFRGLTVEQNIAAILDICEKNHDEKELQLERLLDQFALSHLRQSSALSLSGGERRRVELARALALSPKFLLLDEPFSGIDPIAVGEIKEMILRLKEKGIGILITDHNVREALELVDRAYIIAHGKIIAEGIPEHVVKHKEVRRIYLGERFSI